MSGTPSPLAGEDPDSGRAAEASVRCGRSAGAGTGGGGRGRPGGRAGRPAVERIPEAWEGGSPSPRRARLASPLEATRRTTARGLRGLSGAVTSSTDPSSTATPEGGSKRARWKRARDAEGPASSPARGVPVTEVVGMPLCSAHAAKDEARSDGGGGASSRRTGRTRASCRPGGPPPAPSAPGRRSRGPRLRSAMRSPRSPPSPPCMRAVGSAKCPSTSVEVGGRGRQQSGAARRLHPRPSGQGRPRPPAGRRARAARKRWPRRRAPPGLAGRSLRRKRAGASSRSRAARSAPWPRPQGASPRPTRAGPASASTRS